ncbi:MAG: nitroreductase [Burkholderiaceae bacterium]|nr:nitroreductase [Burkholderiaceae bacterium]
MPPHHSTDFKNLATTERSRLIDEIICSRKSIRAFLPAEIPRHDIEAILQTAARAPSGTNTQPWKVRVLTGAAKMRLVEAVLQVWNNPQETALHKEEYAYYPHQWVSPYIERRRKVGLDLYGLLGLRKEDKQGMHAQHGRNFSFFDAPVGLIFSIDRVMQQGSWLDYGMFLQNIMLAARARGLDTCPQAAWTQFHRIIADQLGFSEEEMLVCGMALGYADYSKIENSLVTERVAVSEFAQFIEN